MPGLVLVMSYLPMRGQERAGRGTKPEARRVANTQRGIRAGGGQSRRLVAATPELSGSDGWSAWSATVQEQPYSLVRSITMSRPDSAVHNGGRGSGARDGAPPQPGAAHPRHGGSF